MSPTCPSASAAHRPRKDRPAGIWRDGRDRSQSDPQAAPQSPSGTETVDLFAWLRLSQSSLPPSQAAGRGGRSRLRVIRAYRSIPRLCRQCLAAMFAAFDVVVERIGNRHGGCAPRLLDKPRAGVSVFLCGQIGVVCGKAAGFDNNFGARGTVAMVLAQIQNHVTQRYLHEQGQVRLEAVLKIDLEAKKSQIEFLSLGDIEDSQNWDAPRKLWCHGMPCRLTKALIAKRC